MKVGGWGRSTRWTLAIMGFALLLGARTASAVRAAASSAPPGSGATPSDTPAATGRLSRLATELLLSDRRLDKPITLHGIGVPLKELLERVSTATGVRVTCAKDLVDRPLVALTDDVPANKVLAALCELFGYRVRAFGPEETGRGAPRYQLLRPQSDYEEEARLRHADQQSFRRWLTALAWSAAPKELVRPPEHDPEGLKAEARQEGTTVGWAAMNAATVLLALGKAQLEALFGGATVRVPLSGLPPALRDPILSGLGNSLFVQYCGDVSYLQSHLDAEIPAQAFAAASLVLRTSPELPRPDNRLELRLEGLDLGDAAAELHLPPNLSPASLWAGGRGPNPTGFSLSVEDVKANRRGREALGLRLTPSLDIPVADLRQAIGPRAGIEAWRLLWELHRSTRAPVVADFALRKGLAFAPGGPNAARLTLGEAIDSLQAAMQVRWSVIQGIHTFRSQAWYLEDSLVPPATSLRSWRSEGLRTSRLGLATLVAFAALSPSRQLRLAASELLPGISGRWVEAHQDELAGLRLWSSLTEEQRRAARTDGLLSAALTVAQRRSLDASEILQASDWRTLHADDKQPESLTLTLSSGPDVLHTLEIASLPCPRPIGQGDPRARCPELEWVSGHPPRPDAALPAVPAAHGPSASGGGASP